MELKILNMQEHYHFYYFYLNDMANDIFHKQTEQKEKKHLFLFPLSIQHPRFHLLFSESQWTYFVQKLISR